MKRILQTGIFLFIFIPDILAWEIGTPIGSKTNSIGNCSVALNEYWSCHNNPAGFANYEYFAVGLSYENKYLLKELAYKNISVIFPFNLGTLSLTASQFGYEHYNENLLGIALSKSFGNNLRIGLKLDYIYFKYSTDYEKKQTATFEIGMQYQINESLCLGAYMFNPINVKLRTLNNEKIPIIMRIGLSYFINDDFMLTAEIEEDFENNFSYRFGLEYEIYKRIFVRSGFQLRPEIFTFGFGYDYNWFTIDISAQMSKDLGSSLSCSFIYKIKDIVKR
ncbi:MAG: transporter [Bacteroidales bacterium]|nr:transporter [Bacteroidales bacterium]